MVTLHELITLHSSGGSGVSYILPLLLNLVHLANAGRTSVRRVVFVWSVRSRGEYYTFYCQSFISISSSAHLAWVSPSLRAAIAAAPPNLAIETKIFVTKSQLLSDAEVPTLEKRSSMEPDSPITVADSAAVNAKSQESFLSVLATTPGRPDVRAILSEEIENAHGPVSVDGKPKKL
jgi:ferric-chelate reductase